MQGAIQYNTIQYNTKKFIERYSRKIESEALFALPFTVVHTIY